MFPFIIAIAISFSWIIQRYIRMTLLSRNGIVGPKPHFIFGNDYEIQKYGRLNCHRKWYKEFGPIVGFYEGGNPFVMVADIDLIRNIQVKDFEKFSFRPEIPKGGVFPGNFRHSIILENGKPWIKQRKLISPNFSTTKLRKLSEIIQNIISTFLDQELFKHVKSKQEFDWSKVFQKLTFSVTTTTSFGLPFDSDTSPDTNPMYEAFSNFTSDAHDRDIISRMLILFPEFEFILYPIRQLYIKFSRFRLSSPTARVDYFSQKVVDSRIESNEKKEDLLQYLIDANNEENLKMEKSGRRKKLLDKNLTQLEVVANVMGFIIAGYETSSTALTYVMHYVIKDPNIRDKILSELNYVNGDPREKMPYLESVINESLRLHPMLPNFVQRKSMTNYKYQNILIPAGTGVVIGVAPLHEDPKHWPNPDTFNPDNFSGGAFENYAFQAFGAGPRMCLGIRLGFLILKMTICHILKNFDPIPSPSSEIEKLTVDEKYFVSFAPKGVWSKIVAKSDQNNN